MSACAWMAAQALRTGDLPGGFVNEWRISQAALDELLEVMGDAWRSGPEMARLMGRHPSHVLRMLREAIARGLVEKREFGRRRLPQYRRSIPSVQKTVHRRAIDNNGTS